MTLPIPAKINISIACSIHYQTLKVTFDLEAVKDYRELIPSFPHSAMLLKNVMYGGLIGYSGHTDPRSGY